MPIECVRCKTTSADGAKFCAECGNSLAPQIGMFNEFLDSTLRNRVHEIFDQHYKDQKVVEIETTQAIASRFLEWSKLVGFVAGIPIALLLLILSILGIKTYTDFSTQVDKATTQVAAQLKTAQEVAKKLKEEGDSLANDYREQRTRLAGTAALGEQLNALSNKVGVIEEKLRFTPTSKLESDVVLRLRAEFDRFERYLDELGYRPKGPRPAVDVVPKENMPPKDGIARFDHEARTIVLSSEIAAEPVFLFSQYMGEVLNKPMRGPYQRWWPYQAITEGLSRYLPASFLDNPIPSTNSPQMNVTRKRSFAGVRLEQMSNDADVVVDFWSNAFWEMRKTIGQKRADKLLFDTWSDLRPEDVEGDRGVSFVQKLLKRDAEHSTEIRAIFMDRGLTP